LLLGAALLGGCSDESAAGDLATCNAACRDQIATRALRDVIKLAYNLTLQGNDVGVQDEGTECPHGGEAHVSGEATSVAAQGASELNLTYRLDRCAYRRRDDEAMESYNVTVAGVVVERGTLAVQPTSTTALIFESEQLSLQGELFDPPVAYSEYDCTLRLFQNGGYLSGTWCDREVGLDL
jgi:hypothetical protein